MEELYGENYFTYPKVILDKCKILHCIDQTEGQWEIDFLSLKYSSSQVSLDRF